MSQRDLDICNHFRLIDLTVFIDDPTTETSQIYTTTYTYMYIYVGGDVGQTYDPWVDQSIGQMVQPFILFVFIYYIYIYYDYLELIADLYT